MEDAEDRVDIGAIFQETLKTIFINMNRVPMQDLAFSLQFVTMLDSQKKAQRYLERLQDTIEVTNVAVMKQPFNQSALIDILGIYKSLGFGSSRFREKIASILNTMVEEKLWMPL